MGLLFLMLIPLGIYALFVALATFAVKKVWLINQAKKANQIHQEEQEYKSTTGKWYSTGWVFDEKTQLWQPPDYLSEESKIKWRWDDEKQIWVDTEKEARMARYKEYHKDRPPTFEEWKAMKEQQQKNEQHPGE